MNETRRSRALIQALCILVVAIGLLPAGVHARSITYAVEPGDSLSRIALRIYGDASAWTIIYNANRSRIDNPDLIAVGQRFVIPDARPEQLASERESRGRVRLVSGDGYPPYAGRSLYRHGLTTDIVEHVFERAGYDVEIVYRDWSEGYRATLAGEFDGTFPYLPSERRQRDFPGLVSRSLTSILVRLFTRADEGIEYRDHHDLAGMTACRPHGHFTHDLAPLVDAGRIELVRTDSVAECFEYLATKRVDFIPVNRFTAAAAVQRAGLDPESFHMSRRPFHRDSLNLLISPRANGARGLLSDFNEALDEMRLQGRLRTLRSDHIARYGSPERAGPWTALFSDQTTPPRTRERDEEAQEAASPADTQPARTEDDTDETTVAASADEEKTEETSEKADPPTTATEATTEDADPPWRLVSGPAYGPFAGPDLPNGGMTTEIIERAAEIMGRTVEIEYQPWPQGYRAAAANEFDGTYPYVRTPYRRGDFTFTGSLYSMPIKIFTLADSSLRYRGLNDLRGTSVCKADGYYRSDIEDLIAAGYTDLVEAETLAGCFERLAAGDVDFVTANRETGEDTIRRLDYHDASDFRILDQPIAEVDLHLMIPDIARDTYSRVTSFDRALEELRKSGELQAIQERHLELHRTRGD